MILKRDIFYQYIKGRRDIVSSQATTVNKIGEFLDGDVGCGQNLKCSTEDNTWDTAAESICSSFSVISAFSALLFLFVCFYLSGTVIAFNNRSLMTGKDERFRQRKLITQIQFV